MITQCNCDLDFLCENCEPLETEKAKEMYDSYLTEYVPSAPDYRDLTLSERLKWGI